SSYEVPVFDWLSLNQQYLSAQLERVRALLMARVSGGTGNSLPLPATSEIQQAMLPARPALDILGDVFHLSPFERDTLLLCAGVELDSDIASLVSRVQSD